MIITKKGAVAETLVLEETFRAPREKVFKAWTKPESLKKWFMADQSVVVSDAAVDLKVGGDYFIETIFPGYDPSRIEGKFQQVELNESLEYTWITPVLEGHLTLVQVQFKEQEQGSSIHLVHGKFQNENQMQLHLQGWEGCINSLHDYLKNQS